MNRTTIALLYILCLLTHYNKLFCQKAVINAAVADLVGQQITTLVPDHSVEALYAHIPVSAGEIQSPMACLRLHQLVYNDIVDIIKIVNDQACICISQAYYRIPSSDQPQHTYWILKKNISLLDDLDAHKICTDHIPQPISFNQENIISDKQLVTLIEPHYDKTMNMSFSAGTRFVKTSSPHKKRSSSIEVFAIDYAHMKERIIKIPCNKCVIDDHIKTMEQRIHDYIQLLRTWAHQKKGCIPYVWGGTTFTKPIHSTFKEVIASGPNGDYSYYEYEKDTQHPKNGFDCSGVILRAAQICGIPYFCKNTTTIAQCLQPLKKENQLAAGDLILIKGHVMVVSDLEKNLLIEARSYGHGYGKLHEISVGDVFDGIETYSDLCDAYYEKKVVKRKDKNGKIRDTFASLQLFPMNAVK
jgi:hypothetical protein